MKRINGLVVIALMVSISSFAQQDPCGEPVFSVEKAICKNWYDRGQELRSGWRLMVKIEIMDDAMVFEEAYFRNGTAKLRLESQKGTSWLVADFETPQKGNENATFKLNPDEAVVSYQREGEKLYCKITNIKQEKPSFHQAMGDGRR